MRRNTLNQLLMSIISLRSSQSSIAQSATKTLSPKASLTVIVKEYMNTYASMEDVICHLIVVKNQKCISKLNTKISKEEVHLLASFVMDHSRKKRIFKIT